MLRDDIKKEVFDFLKNCSRDSSIELQEHMELSEVSIDSIDIMEMVFQLEEEHGIEIQENSFSDTKTLGDIIDVLQSELSEVG